MYYTGWACLFILTCRYARCGYIGYCLFVCFLCVFIRLRIFPPSKWRHILLGGSSASKAGNLTFCGTLLPQKPKIGRIGQRAGHAHLHVKKTVEMRQCKHHARDAPFVKCGTWTQDRHVWIYVSPTDTVFLLVCRMISCLLFCKTSPSLFQLSLHYLSIDSSVHATEINSLSNFTF